MSVIGSQPDVRDRRPDQRNAQRPLTPADDPGIVQVEMVVARVDLDRPRTALGDRAFRRQAIECAVLIPAAVAARQDLADLGIAANEGARKTLVTGTGVSVRVEHGGRQSVKKKKKNTQL